MPCKANSRSLRRAPRTFLVRDSLSVVKVILTFEVVIFTIQALAIIGLEIIHHISHFYSRLSAILAFFLGADQGLLFVFCGENTVSNRHPGKIGRAHV